MNFKGGSSTYMFLTKPRLHSSITIEAKVALVSSFLVTATLVQLHFLDVVMFPYEEWNSFQGPHNTVRHVVANHAGVDDYLGVILFIRPHDVILRCFESLKQRKSQIIKSFLSITWWVSIALGYHKKTWTEMFEAPRLNVNRTYEL